MSDSLTGRCYECGAPVEPAPDPRGRRRRYCSSRCRKRAQRMRMRERAAGVGPQVAAERSKVDAAASLRQYLGPPDLQLALLVGQAYTSSAAMLRLAPELPPVLAARLEILGTLLQEKLEELFPMDT